MPGHDRNSLFIRHIGLRTEWCIFWFKRKQIALAKVGRLWPIGFSLRLSAISPSGIWREIVEFVVYERWRGQCSSALLSGISASCPLGTKRTSQNFDEYRILPDMTTYYHTGRTNEGLAYHPAFLCALFI